MLPLVANDKTWRGNIDLAYNEQLQIVVTHEGIILDHFVGEDSVSTVSMTFDEWVEWMADS